MNTTPRPAPNTRAFRGVSYALVFLLMVCAIMTIGTLIQTTLPDWHAGIITGILIFIVLDRMYTHRQSKSLTPLSTEWAVSVGAQWALILVLSRFLLSAANGWDTFQADLALFVRGYLAEFFTAEFTITLFLAILAWFLTAQFLSLLDEIGLDVEIALSDEPPALQMDIVPAHQRLVNLVFSLGIAVVLLTVLTRLNVRTILSNQSGLPDVQVSRFSGAEAGALLFFVFALTLLSLSRLMSLQTHWNRLRIPVSSQDLVRKWGTYSLLFIVALAILVSLLPAGNTLGFFSVLGTLLGYLGAILFFIGQMILFVISLLFSLPMMLLMRGDDSLETPGPLPTPVLPPAAPAGPPPDNETWMLVRSVLLWAVLIAIIAFALIQFIRQHGGIRAALRQSRLTNWLARAWQWLYSHLDNTRGVVSRAITEGWESLVSRLEGKRILSSPGLVRLRALDPRRQVYFFYLAMVRRGGEQGVRRESSQTPAEYAAQLETALPTAAEDIDALTAAFVEARYSRQTIDPEKAGSVKAMWGRIRRALQGNRRPDSSVDK